SYFFFSSRRRHTRSKRDWSSDVCSSDLPVSLEYKLEVWDAPNSAGVIIDAIRAAKIALDRKVGGPILSASSYFMKSPPVQHHDEQAHDLVEAFIAGDIER